MEDILHVAITNGLSFADFENLTIGMIVDFCTACSNSKVTDKDDVYASQADIDAF